MVTQDILLQKHSLARHYVRYTWYLKVNFSCNVEDLAFRYPTSFPIVRGMLGRFVGPGLL